MRGVKRGAGENENDADDKHQIGDVFLFYHTFILPIPFLAGRCVCMAGGEAHSRGRCMIPRW